MSRIRERLPAIVAAIGALTVAGSYARWRIMPWAPRWLFPALAVVGAAVVAWVFAGALRRFVAAEPGARRRRAIGLAGSLAALILLGLLPAARLLVLLRPASPGAPKILSGFGDWLGAEGYPRIDGSHNGLDVAAPIGRAVLAAADGRIVVAREPQGSCGRMIVIEHGADDYRTLYCHLSQITVRAGDRVRRGDRVGAVGISGMAPWPGYEHVHWALQKGRLGPWEDPRPRLAGCFDGLIVYPTDRLALTYPVPC